MTKRNKIIYWIATIWFSLGMVSSGIVQLMKLQEETDMIINLGYPVYILNFLGVSKILGVIALLIPGFPVLKEWAYAGFVFTMCGALYSHLMIGDPISETFAPVFLLVLCSISWHFRPAGRKVVEN